MLRLFVSTLVVALALAQFNTVDAQQDNQILLYGVGDRIAAAVSQLRSAALNLTECNCTTDITTALSTAIGHLNTNGPQATFFEALDNLTVVAGNQSDYAAFRNLSQTTRTSIASIITEAIDQKSQKPESKPPTSSAGAVRLTLTVSALAAAAALFALAL